MSLRVLFVLHDAGGTVPPVLAVAQAVLAEGGQVAVLSQPSVRARAERIGCSFIPFSSLPDYDTSSPIERQLDIAMPALAGRGVGDDLVAAVERCGADVVVADPNLTGCLAAAATLSAPTAVLLHSMYRTFVDTWFGDLWPFLADAVNETRAGFGLGPATGWAQLFGDHDLVISAVPRLFEAPIEGALPANLRSFGFLVPAAPPTTRAAFPDGSGPSVLVSWSTTYQAQEALLPAIVGALAQLEVRILVTTSGRVPLAAFGASDRVVIEDYVPHAAVVADADVVVTHGGLGTVAAALAAGVPAVCAPHHRDQPLNAQRVEELGAGSAADAGDPRAVARAVEDVLADGRCRRRAASIAAASRAEGGAKAVARALAALC